MARKATATKMVVSAKRVGSEFEINQSQIDLFESVCLNIQNIGNKMFAFIPLSLIEIDDRFQRIDTSSKKKINVLAEKWDSDKMDPVRVTIHEKEKTFSVIDGFHRVTAAKQIGKTHLACEVINVPQEDVARLKREAELFATQMDEVEKLTPLQKHKANLLRGVKANVDLEKICQKYDVPIRTDMKRGNRKWCGYLSGFYRALSYSNINPDMLDKVFDLICYIGWAKEQGGFSNENLAMFWNVLSTHPDDQDAIIETLKEWLRKKDPNFVRAKGNVDYAERTQGIRSTLVLEDYLHETINIPYVYKVKKRKVAVA